MGVAFAMEMLLTLPTSDSIHAARMFGATTALNNQLGIANGHRLDGIRESMIAGIGQTRFDASVREGRRWTWEHAVDEASALN